MAWFPKRWCKEGITSLTVEDENRCRRMRGQSRVYGPNNMLCAN